MSNPFLNNGHEEIETAILLEKAIQCDLSEINRKYEKAVAFTDGNKVFVNSDDNLSKILPDYSHKMLKWLLWHEEYHNQLKHHNRFFRYLEELNEEETMDEFRVTKEEVNIIMDILVHDSLSKLFPELVTTALNNLAQMRNRNSLDYTFKTHTLEEMLDEYSKHKHLDDDKSGAGSEGEEGDPDKTEETDEDKDGKKKADKKGHEDGGSDSPKKSPKATDDEIDEDDTKPTPPAPEHHKTDWSKLDEIDTTEFIDEYESEVIQSAIVRLKQKKLKLARLTEKLNGLATTTRVRSYAIPSYIRAGENTILKGRKQGKASLYLVFDASGSMGEELSLFKKIISETIPQAMTVPTEWFSGSNSHIKPNFSSGKGYDYYKGTFKDIISVYANSGYSDDGDRVIALCLEAEQQGFTPIGVTDGGGGIYEPDVLKKLTKTVLVGNNKRWLEKAKEINPRIQTIDI